ncbi:MAG: S-methyl-5-thioribose-1-phosphate isomerase, partial [Leptolyngbyaceae cyanobacterium RM2_2_21]|nr:S-methyl-5-thioribose-1-phosphate isomerase [Leptolyngbyaceae cyanobacterium RM2_2_21]
MAEISETHVYPVIWQDEHVLLVDQNRLPLDYTLVSISRFEDMVRAIKTLIVRGAPAVGIAAAYGLYLGAKEIPTRDRQAFIERLEAVAEQLKNTRPDKANLGWAVDFSLKKVCNTPGTVEYLIQTLLETAQTLQREDLQTCYAIGDYGLKALPEIPERLSVYTHCNHGALATSGYGTSLGIVRAAWHSERLERVYVGETRPRLQGSRLSAWECVQEGIPVTIVTDSMAAHCMKQGLVQAVLVGADRIAVNGDTLNKIGTYGLALLAKAHSIPFFVAAPLSTVDIWLKTAEAVSVSENPSADIYQIGETLVALAGPK